jgi:FkbM family methyltransferase
MNQKLKSRLWTVVSPLVGWLAGLRPLAPEACIQLDVERKLHQYLHVPAEKISQVVVVGAHEAEEIRRMHKSFSQADFLCFEPNPKSFQKVVDKYQGCSWVTARKLALSDAPGNSRFYELSIPENGSLLEPDLELWATTVELKWKDKSMTFFEVELSTLDRETASLPSIDLLWMDVQGAEGKVLAGGLETLKRTKAIFLEVALVRSPYKGAMLFPEIKAKLEAAGFMCVALGVNSWNGNGNAFFVRGYDQLICK